MYVLLICPRNGVVHFHDRCIDDNMRALLDADRTHKACAAARRCNRRILCHAKFLRTRNSILHLDFIDFVITANEGEDKLVLICLIGDRLDRLFDGNTQKVNQCFNGRSVRCHHLFQRLPFLCRRFDDRKFCFFVACCIIALGADGNTRFAVIRQYGEFM